MRDMRKKPEKLSLTLSKLLTARGMASHLSEYRILGQWEKTVGRTIAAHARPVSVRGKKLFLAVDSTAWMQQLSLLKPEIIEKVNRGLGREAIKDMTLNLGEVAARERQLPEEAMARASELSADERESIEQHLGEVRDSDLKQVLRRLIAKDLANKKAKQKK